MSELMEKIDRLTTKFASQDLTEVCAVEELAELTMAIQHKVRGRPANLAEEIAHVTIMIESLRKKYAVETSEILFHEYIMTERYLNNKTWDGSHVPGQVRHNVKYKRNDKVFTFTTASYKDAMETLEKMKKREDITVIGYYPSDAKGTTPRDIADAEQVHQVYYRKGGKPFVEFFHDYDKAHARYRQLLDDKEVEFCDLYNFG